MLIDASPDMRTQLLACGVPRIDGILFTHAHADHVLGIDDIRILNRIVKRPLDMFAEARTMTELTRRFDYAFKGMDGSAFLPSSAYAAHRGFRRDDRDLRDALANV